MGGDSAMLDKGTMETTTDERCRWKPDRYSSVNAPLNQRSNFSISSDVNLQYYYLSAQTEVFIEKYFAHLFQPPHMDSTLSSLLSVLNDRKVRNVTKAEDAITAFI